MQLIQPGSIIMTINSYEEKEYFVYLVKIEEIVYAAQIVYAEEYDKLIEQETLLHTSGMFTSGKNPPLLCYTILKTKDLEKITKSKKNAASFMSPYCRNNKYSLVGELDTKDKENLQKEILDSIDSVPGDLIREIQKISFSSSKLPQH
jgi:hypothetical protein